MDIEQIYDFISYSQGIPLDKLTPDSDLYELGVDGDDFVELMDAFEQEFAVNLEAYRWYFHHAEEGAAGVGGFLFKPPNATVQRIPITPNTLLNAAEEKNWPIDYPEHHTPSIRYDLVTNRIVVLGFAIWFVVWLSFF